MSTQLIQQYHAKVERIIRYGGSRNESALRKPFQDLLEQYAASRDLLLVSEVEYRRRGVRVIPDGDTTGRLALREESKELSFGAVWDYYCLTRAVPVGMDFASSVRAYARTELAKRA